MAETDPRNDPNHGCPLPWTDYRAPLRWECPECGRQWYRTWAECFDMTRPPVNWDRVMERAGLERFPFPGMESKSPLT